MSQRKMGPTILEYRMRHLEKLRMRAQARQRHPAPSQQARPAHRRLKQHHRHRHKAVLAEEELNEQLKVPQMTPERQLTTCNQKELLHRWT